MDLPIDDFDRRVDRIPHLVKQLKGEDETPFDRMQRHMARLAKR